MTVKHFVEEALAGYKGDELQAVLIGFELWPEFLAETGLEPQKVGSDDVEVVYNGIACRPSATPDQVNLLIGH